VRKRGQLSRPGGLDEVRGGSALAGSVDTTLVLEPDPRDDLRRTLYVAKLRHGPALRPRILEVQPTGRLQFVAEARAGTQKVTQPEIVEALRTLGPSTKVELAEHFEVNPTTILRAMGTLDIANAIVECGKRGKAKLFGLRFGEESS
jgi:hypothetical protein